MLFALLVGTQSGCSLFVMAGKMIFGDPKLPAPFHSATGNNLIKNGKKVIVICSTPETIKGDFPSLELDMLEQIARHLKGRGVSVVNPDDVASWMDDRGSYTDDAQELAEQFDELAEQFDADLVAHVDLSRFSYLEENSPTLFRGRAIGNVFVYQAIKNKNGTTRVREIFVREYVSVYPKHYPISTGKMSDKVFRKRYLDRVSAQIAQLFYDHRASEELE